MSFPRFKASRAAKGDAREAAETIALRALAYLAEDAGRLGRFVALTGLGPDELRASADQPATLAAVLAYMLEDEASLLAFTANAGLRPEEIEPARALLAGEAPSRE
jgi:hypothetical protein